MELYIVQFYDANESGCVEHNEAYTTFKAAEKRYNFLERNLNGYSWVYLWNARSVFGRVRQHNVIYGCSSCQGEREFYHGDDSDF